MAKSRVKIPNSVKELRKEAVDYYRLVYRDVASGNEKEEIDQAAIMLLAIEYAKYLDASDMIAEDGLILINSRKDKVAHPAIAIQKAAINTINAIWSNIGATPQSRKKITKGAEPGKAQGKKRANISVVKN